MKKPLARALIGIAALLAIASSVYFASRSRESARQAEQERAKIQVNVPSSIEFDRLLLRDLSLFFRQSSGRVVSVEPALLNRWPIAGPGFPRYYIWVRVLRSKKLLAEGVARAEAVQKKRFDVTSFVSRAELRQNPKILDSAPEEVRDAVRARLK